MDFFIRKTLNLFTASFLVITAPALLWTAPDNGADSLESCVPHEPGLTIGKLANGLRYYIKENGHEPGYCELELVVRVGSQCEQEHERGIAHVIEHLAFMCAPSCGSRQELAATFSNFGINMGPHVTAFTDYDHTVYKLTLPLDNKALLEQGFLWLSEVAGKLEFTDLVVKNECLIALDEMRISNNSDARFWDNMNVPGLNFAQYAPIGTQKALELAMADTVMTFYQTWYRPDTIALIFVGNCSTEPIRALIEKHFSPLPAKAGPTPPLAEPPLSDQEAKVEICLDKEATDPLCYYCWATPRPVIDTKASLKDRVVLNLVEDAVNQRFCREVDRPASPFCSLWLGAPLSTYSRRLWMMGGKYKKETLLPAVERLGQIRQTLLSRGLVPAELEGAKQALIAEEQSLREEFGKAKHNHFSEQYRKHFIFGHQSLQQSTIAVSHLVEAIATAVTLEEANKALVAHLSTPAVFYCFLSDKHAPTGSLPDLEKLVTLALARASEADVETSSSGAATLEHRCLAGQVGQAQTEPYDAINGYKFILSNGITVYLKPMAARENIITITAKAPGGLANLGKAAGTMRYTQDLCAYTGFGGATPADFSELQAKHPTINFGHSLQVFWRNLWAVSSTHDLELCLRLLILFCTEPNQEPGRFDMMKTQIVENITNKRLNAAKMYETFIAEMAHQHPFLTKEATPEQIQHLKANQVYSDYAWCFGDLTQFTFIITGNISPDKLQHILEQTLGKLSKPENRGEVNAQRPIFAPPTPGQEVFPQRSVGQCHADVLIPVSAECVQAENRVLSIICQIICKRFYATLLENWQSYERYATYVWIEPIAYDPEENIRLRLHASGAPENIHSIAKEMVKLTATAIKDGFTSDELTTAKKSLIQSLQENAQSEEIWHSVIAKGIFHNSGKILGPEEMIECINELSLEKINAFAKEHIDTRKAYTLFLLPEGA